VGAGPLPKIAIAARLFSIPLSQRPTTPALFSLSAAIVNRGINNQVMANMFLACAWCGKGSVEPGLLFTLAPCLRLSSRHHGVRSDAGGGRAHGHAQVRAKKRLRSPDT
jgi:hypothetical protein